MPSALAIFGLTTLLHTRDTQTSYCYDQWDKPAVWFQVMTTLTYESVETARKLKTFDETTNNASSGASARASGMATSGGLKNSYK
jgi:hypothetical protein